MPLENKKCKTTTDFHTDISFEKKKWKSVTYLHWAMSPELEYIFIVKEDFKICQMELKIHEK